VMMKCHIIVFLMLLASHVHSYHTFSSTTTITNAISSSLSSGITNYYHQHDGRRAFILSRSRLFSSESSSSSNSIDGGSNDSSAATKGFGKKKVPSVVDTEAVKDVGTKTYENQAKRGVPEYNIFLRPVNGTDVEWVPVGSMTIPRDTKISKAVYDVEKELLTGTFKLYPKLKVFYELRNAESRDNMFQYGYCLKAFPDEEIKVIVKEDGTQKDTNFFTNWLGRLTNPMDTDSLKNPGEMTIKQ